MSAIQQKQIWVTDSASTKLVHPSAPSESATGGLTAALAIFLSAAPLSAVATNAALPLPRALNASTAIPAPSPMESFAAYSDDLSATISLTPDAAAIVSRILEEEPPPNAATLALFGIDEHPSA